MISEVCISVISLRGSILNTAPRASMQYLLYVRLGEYIFFFSLEVNGLIYFIFFNFSL